MSRSSSTGNLFCAGDEFQESESNEIRPDSAEIRAGSAPGAWLRGPRPKPSLCFKMSRSSAPGDGFGSGDEFAEESESERAWTALGSDGAAPKSPRIYINIVYIHKGKMSRSSPAFFGDEFSESESESERAWTALGSDGAPEPDEDSDGSGEGSAPRFAPRSGEGSAPRGGKFPESESNGIRLTSDEFLDAESEPESDGSGEGSAPRLAVGALERAPPPSSSKFICAGDEPLMASASGSGTLDSFGLGAPEMAAASGLTFTLIAPR